MQEQIVVDVQYLNFGAESSIFLCKVAHIFFFTSSKIKKFKLW